MVNAFKQSGWFAHNWIQKYRKQNLFSIALFLQKYPAAANAAGLKDTSIQGLNTPMFRLATQSPKSTLTELSQARNSDLTNRREYLRKVHQQVEEIDRNMESLTDALQSYQQLLQQLSPHSPDNSHVSGACSLQQLNQELAQCIGYLTNLTEKDGITTELLTLSTQSSINTKMDYARGREKFQALQTRLNTLFRINQPMTASSSSSSNDFGSFARIAPLIDQLQQRYQHATQQSTIQDMVQCIHKTLKLPEPINTPTQIYAWVEFFNKKKKTTPSSIVAQTSNFMQLQLKRLTLFRMLQTTPLGELNLDDWFVIHNGYLPSSASSAEDLYFQLFSDITNQLGIESLTVDQHDNEVLVALDPEFWKDQQNVGSHALHMLANSGEAGQVVNHNRLITRCIEAFPALLNLRAMHGGHQNWNILHFVLFHFVRTQSLKKAEMVSLCQKIPTRPRNNLS